MRVHVYSSKYFNNLINNAPFSLYYLVYNIIFSIYYSVCLAEPKTRKLFRVPASTRISEIKSDLQSIFNHS